LYHTIYHHQLPTYQPGWTSTPCKYLHLFLVRPLSGHIKPQKC
jgi:hypothetical protein